MQFSAVDVPRRHVFIRKSTTVQLSEVFCRNYNALETLRFDNDRPNNYALCELLSNRMTCHVPSPSLLQIISLFCQVVSTEARELINEQHTRGAESHVLLPLC